MTTLIILIVIAIVVVLYISLMVWCLNNLVTKPMHSKWQSEPVLAMLFVCMVPMMAMLVMGEALLEVYERLRDLRGTRRLYKKLNIPAKGYTARHSLFADEVNRPLDKLDK
jgi:hypothetical protein